MKVVNMGNIADAFKFNDLPATGIVIEATPEELKLLPNLAYKDVTISERVGNAAAMREALEQIHELLSIGGNPDTAMCIRYEAAYQIAAEALSAPPRNGDVGTAEEQSARFDAHCRKHMGCFACPLREKDGGVPKHCEFEWSQMPYENGGAE